MATNYTSLRPPGCLCGQWCDTVWRWSGSSIAI